MGKKVDFETHVYSYAVHGDHVHISFRISSRASYVKWIRSVNSDLVRRIAGLKFQLRPWTRIVAWGRAFKGGQAYIELNNIEAEFLASGLDRIDVFKARIYNISERPT